MVVQDGVLCLIFQSYDLILIEEATGTSYTEENVKTFLIGG
jgi:hypothetical protein